LANLLIALWFIVLARTFFQGIVFSGVHVGLVVTSFCQILFIAAVILLVDSLLNAMQAGYERLPVARSMSIKGFVQAIKLIVFLIGFIFVLATILGKSPAFFLSGLGALTAVLLLIFKDAILGVVAGIQISANRMLKLGDWIEMPTHLADGDVVDLSLTTVKVQNWDKTITAIPSYELIARPFKNWSGMQESGRRRIKRSIMIDMRSIGFADEAMMERFSKLRLLKEYLGRKASEIQSFNASIGVGDDAHINGRSITNIGTFRAYCEAYLRSHSATHKEMTLIVRQLAPTAEGLPIELYFFSNDTRWVQYEGIQSDVFDHLLAVLPYFGLAVFQSMSGRDLENGLQKLRSSVPDAG
jgi:miniconductance mechanosensitive channel